VKWKETDSICKIFIFWQGLYSESLVICKWLLSTYSQICVPRQFHCKDELFCKSSSQTIKDILKASCCTFWKIVNRSIEICVISLKDCKTHMLVFFSTSFLRERWCRARESRQWHIEYIVSLFRVSLGDAYFLICLIKKWNSLSIL
jgi:hypothetical protein